MKLVAAIFAGGLVAGGWFLFGDWQDPRTAGPAPIPARYLELARAECVEGLSRAGEAAAGSAAFCGCVTAEVGKRFSFRAFRAAHVQLEKARAEAGEGALPDLLRAHETLGPILRACAVELSNDWGPPQHCQSGIHERAFKIPLLLKWDSAFFWQLHGDRSAHTEPAL